MKKAKKVLTLAACAVLLVCVTVGATVAYLTATTNQVQNTFTVGNVTFGDPEDMNDGLDEAKVDEYGKPILNAERVTENTYKLLPGHEYTKDPTVTIGAGSEPCYVRMFVKISDLADVKAVLGKDETTGYFLPQNFVGGWDNAVWATTKVVDETTYTNAAVYEFWYVVDEGKVDALEEKQVLPALFTTIKVPEDVTNDQLQSLKEMKIEVIAQAVQADGFASQEDAWAQIAKPEFATESTDNT